MGSFSGKVDTTLRTFTSASGRSRRTGGTINAVYPVTFEWAFLPEEYATFYTWWKVTQNSGSLPFTIDMRTGASILTHTCQFTELPAIRRSTGLWRVTVDAKIVARPSGISPSWVLPFVGPPATFPYSEVGFPQMSYGSKVAQNFVTTDGLSEAAVPTQQVGTDFSLSWVLTGTAFDYLLEWYSKALRFGQAKFVASFGEIGTKLFTVVDEASFNLSGMNYKFSLKVQGVDYASSGSTGYIINRAEDFTVDRWINRAEDSAADRKINKGQL